MEKKSAKKRVIRKSAKTKTKTSNNTAKDETTHSEQTEERVGGEVGGDVDTDTDRPQSAICLTSGRTITVEERKEIAEAFKMLDENGDGKLGFEEMKKLLQSQFMTFTDAAATDVINQLDEDGSGEIEFEEFEKYVVENNLCKPTVEEFSSEMKAAFEMFDTDNNGYIDASEFRALMGNVGDMMSEAEVTEMMQEADTNGDGFIDYREFCLHMTKAL